MNITCLWDKTGRIVRKKKRKRKRKSNIMTCLLFFFVALVIVLFFAFGMYSPKVTLVHVHCALTVVYSCVPFVNWKHYRLVWRVEKEMWKRYLGKVRINISSVWIWGGDRVPNITILRFVVKGWVIDFVEIISIFLSLWPLRSILIFDNSFKSFFQNCQNSTATEKNFSKSSNFTKLNVL